MERLKLVFTLILALTLGLLTGTSANAQNSVDPQNVEVIVTPDDAEIEVGQSLKLDLFSFVVDGNRAPARVDSVWWEVTPDSMGVISEDGFFIAGKHAGKVIVIARIKIGDRVFERRVVIIIRARQLDHYFDLQVIPSRAVVAPEDQQQFEAVLRTRTGRTLRPDHLRWEVKPEELGRIDGSGLFTAGAVSGHGKVIALAEIEGLVLRAAAKVAVSEPATGAIAGTVTNDNTTNALEGAKVKAVRLGRVQWIATAESDADGNYLIGGLIPGFYVVYSNARGFIGEFYDDTRLFLEATPLNIAEADTARGVDFGLSEGGQISGQVLADGEDGAPLPNAHVAAFLIVNPRFARHTTTDENGRYVIESLPSGSYAVKANANGYMAEFYDDAQHRRDLTPVVVSEPNTADGIDFALATESAISGVVVEASDTATPIAGAHVVVFRAQLGPNTALSVHHRPFKETRTDENGAYLIQVRPGLYHVFATANGFDGEFFENKQSIREADDVEVVAGQHTTGIDFSLGTRGSIAGQVTDQVTGEPIAGAVVEAFKENARIDTEALPGRFLVKTDDSGNYLIENVPAGKYLLLAKAREYLPEFYEESPNKSGATFLVLETGQDTVGIDFTLEMGGSISGFVGAKPDSTPLSGALVQVWNTETKRSRKAYTDEEGHYKVGGLPSGDYIVRVIARGFFAKYFDDARNRSEADPVAVTSPNETSGIDLYLAPIKRERGTLAGRVVSDDDESPLLGAVVIAVRLNTRHPFVTFSGPRGFYELTDLPEGDYIVFAWAEGFIGEFFKDAHRVKDAQRVAVHSGQVTDGVSFGLRPQRRRGIYAIRGRVRDAQTGQPLDGISVFARIEGEVALTAITDLDGRYVIDGLPSGNYQVTASSAGFADSNSGGDDGGTVIVGSGADAGGIDLDMQADNVTSVDTDDDFSAGPNTFNLSQNYPNPFNPETTIKYQLGQASEVSLRIFNVLGQEVRTLVNEDQLAGGHSVTWDGRDDLGRQVASGIYIFRISAGDFKMSRRMLLLK